MNIYNRQEVENFINNVVRFYNGRVNKFNTHIDTRINWAHLYNSAVAAYHMQPNIIIVNPIVISREYPTEFKFKFSVIQSIIHELFHMDQFIDLYLLMHDFNYREYIENAVETQTYIYLAEHTADLLLFGFSKKEIDAAYRLSCKLIPKYDGGYTYYRRDQRSHLFMILQNFFGSDLTINEVFDLYDNGYDVELIINQQKIIVNKYSPIDIVYINNIFNHIFNACDRTSGSLEFRVSHEDKLCIISINDFKSSRIMCTKEDFQ